MSLDAQELSYTWSFREGRSEALRGFSGEFTPGVPQIICGPSGSGKSTLSYLLAGLMQPSGGAVRLNGADLPSQRAKIAYVFQFAENIFFQDSVRDEVEQWSQRGEVLDTSWFERLGIELHKFENLNPFHLSQGYGRLVAIAMQLARNPELLILDEPTIGLDWKFQSRVVDAFREWITPQRTVIVITHDLEVMQRLGGVAWVLKSGELAWKGETETLLNDAALLREYGLEA